MMKGKLKAEKGKSESKAYFVLMIYISIYKLILYKYV